MLRPSFYASATSTLQVDKLPATDGCELEQLVDDGPNCPGTARVHLLASFFPCWLAVQLAPPPELPFDSSASLYFLGAIILFAIGVAKQGPLPMRLLVLLCDAVVLVLLPRLPRLGQVGLSLAILATFAGMFVKHYYHLRTASLDDFAQKRRIRRGLNWRLALALVAFPVALAGYGVIALRFPAELGRAFVSFLTYNQAAIRAGGVFQSPAGSCRARVLAFHLTVMVLAVTFGSSSFVVLLPFPGILALKPALIFLLASSLCWLPALLVIACCQMLLAPFLFTLSAIPEVSDDRP